MYREKQVRIGLIDLVQQDDASVNVVEHVVQTADGEWTVEYLYDDSTVILYGLEADGRLGQILETRFDVDDRQMYSLAPDIASRPAVPVPPRRVMECWSIRVLRLVRVAPADWRIQIRRVSR